MNASSSPVRYDDAIVVGRVPALPIATAHALYASAQPFEELRRFVADDPAIGAAIRLASPSLYGSLVPWLAGATPKNKRTRIGVLGYVLRMATRCTPFGLFASIGVVNVGDTTTLQVDVTHPKRVVARPDVRWIYGRLAQLVHDPQSVWGARVVTNDLVVQHGDALYIMDGERATRIDIGARTPVWRYDAVHIRANDAVHWLRATAAAAMRVDELVGRTAQRFRTTPEIALRLVQKLLDAGVLTFVRPSLLGDPLADLVLLLGEHPDAARLTRVAEAVAAFERDAEAGTGVTVAAIASLDTQLQDGYRVEGTAFGIDAVHDFAGSLGANVMADAALLAAVMLNDGSRAQLEPYLKRFIDRYESLDRLIPLLELTDDDFILEPEGAPSGVSATRERLLAGIAAVALRDGRAEVVLDAADFDRLFPGLRGAKLAQTCEIGFVLGARDAAAVDAGAYLIAPTAGANSDGVAKSTGRVSALLGTAFADRVRIARAAQRNAGSVVAELDYVPLETRAGNLITRGAAHPYAIADAATPPAPGVTRISPADILIGVEDGAFVAYSKSLGCRLEIAENYLLETGYFAPPHMRFLAQIGQAARRTPRPFDWGDAARALPFLPRLRFGRVVIAVARWIVPRSDLLGDDTAVQRTLANWRTAWHLPRWVYLTDRDVKLLLDLDSPLALELLRDQIPKYRAESVLFEEMLPAFEDTWLAGTGGAVAHEFVASFSVRETAARSAPIVDRDFAAPPLPLSPASRWTFVKLYAGVNDLPALIRDVLPQLIDGCAALSDRCFFLRYHDPAHHIRLRLQAAEPGNALPLRVMELLEPLVQSGRIARYTFDTYRQEPERFGGRLAIEPVERLFAADSRRVLDAIATRGGGESVAAFALRTLAPFLRAWFERFDLAAWLAVTSARSRGTDQIDYDLVRSARGWLDSPDARAQPDEHASIAEIAALEIAGTLTQPSGYVLGALVHVHFNRAGVEFAAESQLEAHLWRALRAFSAGGSPAERSQPTLEQTSGQC